MSSITAYQQAIDSGVVVAQDVLALAAAWEPGVTMPEEMFDEDGLLESVLDDYNLVTLGRLDKKSPASFTPDASYNEIRGIGASAPRRRILETEGMDIALNPQEMRKIAIQIQQNLAAGAFETTSTGGWRSKKLAGTPPKYWSLLFVGLDFNERTGGEILPWWFFGKTGTDKGSKTSLATDAPIMGEQNLKLFQDGANLYEFGIDGPGWVDLAGDLGFGAERTFTVTISGTPTGGTWTFTVDGQTATGLLYNITATNLRSALEALSSVGAGHVTVTGSAGGPYTVVFDETVSGTPTVNGSGLTGGTTPSVAIAAA